MADGDDLPDHDYASIYGHDAAHARLMARLDAILQRQNAMLARVEAGLAQMAERRRQEGEEGAGA